MCFEPTIQFFSLGIGGRNLLRRGRDAIPEILGQLHALGHAQSKNLTQAVFSHGLILWRSSRLGKNSSTYAAPPFSRPRFLDDPDFLVRQHVQFINQLVDLPIRCVDLALKGRLLVVGFCRRGLLVER